MQCPPSKNPFSGPFHLPPSLFHTPQWQCTAHQIIGNVLFHRPPAVKWDGRWFRCLFSLRIQQCNIRLIVLTATVIAVATAVVVAPDAVALAAFVVALTVVATTVFAVAVALVVDCCVPLPPEEDHRLPPPLGKVPSWPSLLCPLCPSSACFTLALSVTLVVCVITALTIVVAFVDCCEPFVVYPHPSLRAFWIYG
jgi:hypothetical protein